MAGGPFARAVAALEHRAPRLERVLGPWHRHRWLRWITGTGFALAAIAFVVFNWLWFSVQLPDEPPHPQAALILSADGHELAAVAPEGLRFDVELDEIAPVAVQAVIAAEDRRFYEHSGLDPIGVGRAVWKNLRGGQQGGSTITQQLVKVDYLSRERSLWRKMREAVLAVKLERSADKDEILERYLNTVYFGRNAYGIEAAARAYFATTAAKLTLGQAALLAGLIRAPEDADPAENPDVAEGRRELVLTALIQEGVIDAAEADAASATPIDAVPEQRGEIDASAAPHFVDLVREQTLTAVGEGLAQSAGLRVFTTIDLAAQQTAEAAVKEILDGHTPQAALVALDADGAIRAYVGGRDHDALKLDLVRGADGGGSGRQPGSTFKPFVLAAALSEDITLGQRFTGPPNIELDINGETWSVDNYGNEAFGDLDLIAATAHSVNTIYAQLVDRVGPDAVADAAHAFGITSELDPVPAIALGAVAVSPFEMARAFSTLANDGTKTEPYAIDRIENSDGTVIWRPDRSEPERAVPEAIARGVTHALRQVIVDGTATAADIGRPAAGKTGTTQDNVDAWFAGYVPGYTAVVWLGNPEGSIPIAEASGRPITGGGLPAQIWQQFMTHAVADREPADFPAPPPEMLEAPPAPTLTIEPADPKPGDTITIRGEGFDACQVSWYVELDGTDVRSAPETGSTSSQRAATLQVPAAPGDDGSGDAEGGPPPQLRFIAYCDDGTGVKPIAEATAAVATTTTSSTSSTSSSTSSSTTTTQPPRTTTTTTTRPKRTTTTERTSTTTTTTQPPATTTTNPSDSSTGDPTDD